jgi:hypothetical protein
MSAAAVDAGVEETTTAAVKRAIDEDVESTNGAGENGASKKLKASEDEVVVETVSVFGVGA